MSGTPRKAGTYSFVLKATDKNGITASKNCKVTITAKSTVKAAAKVVKIAQACQTSAFAPKSVAATETSTSNEEVHHHESSATEIKVISDVLWQGTERDEDLVGVRANEPITFQIGKWLYANGTPRAVSDVLVFIDEKAEYDITISDEGVFTVPAERVVSDFKVQATAMDGNTEIESAELFVSVEE